MFRVVNVVTPVPQRDGKPGRCTCKAMTGGTVRYCARTATVVEEQRDAHNAS